MLYAISYKRFLEFINAWDCGRYVDKERYITKNNDLYLGIDNRQDTCSIECFSSMYQTVLWLVTGLEPDEIKNKKSDECLKILNKNRYSIVELDGMHFDAFFLLGNEG